MDVASLLCELRREVKRVRDAAAEVDAPELAEATDRLGEAQRVIAAKHASVLERRFRPVRAPAGTLPERQTTQRRPEPATQQRRVGQATRARRPAAPAPVDCAVPSSRAHLHSPLHRPTPSPTRQTRRSGPNPGSQSVLQNRAFHSSLPSLAPARHVPSPPPSPPALPDVDMDAFSTLAIRDGKLDTHAPEYLAYRRRYAPEWGEISQLIGRLEKLAQNFKVPEVLVDGFKLARLEEFKDVDLLECVPHARGAFKVCGLRFRTDPMPSAATYVTACFRMRKQVRAFKLLKTQNACARVVQLCWRMRQMLRTTRDRIERIRADRMQRFLELQSAEQDMSQRQIEVHIGSLSAVPEGRRAQTQMMMRQKEQIMRLFRLIDQNVDVIYVAPEPLEEEMLEYFVKILQFRGIRSPPGRLQVVAPENTALLPTCSLTAALLWSPRALARIKTLVSGRRACVVPYLVSRLEPELCAVLGAPLFAATAEQATKANSLRLLKLTKLPTPVSSLDLSSPEEFYAAFTQLLMQHPDVDQWVFKLEDEVDGRGLGTIDMAQLKMVADVRRKHTERRAAAPHAEHTEQQEHLQVQSMLQKHLPKKAVMRGMSFRAYLAALPGSGGLIQAVPAGCVRTPTVHFVVTKAGTEVLGTSEPVQPFSSVRRIPAEPHPQLRETAASVGAAMQSRGIVGFASVDCVVAGEELQVIDVDLRMTRASSCLLCVVFMTKTYFDQDCLRCTGSNETRVCLVTTSLPMPSMPPTYTRLFEVFRVARASFDLLENVGMILLHADTKDKQLALGAVAKTFPKAVSDLLGSLGLFDSADGEFGDAISALRSCGRRRTQGAATHESLAALPGVPRSPTSPR